MPCAVAELLARVAAVAESGRSYLITLSVVELYGDQVHDLLAGPGALPLDPKPYPRTSGVPHHAVRGGAVWGPDPRSAGWPRCSPFGP